VIGLLAWHVSFCSNTKHSTWQSMLKMRVTLILKHAQALEEQSECIIHGPRHVDGYDAWPGMATTVMHGNLQNSNDSHAWQLAKQQ
jgi:hypothetical protein